MNAVNYGVGHAAVSGNAILGHGTAREVGLLFDKGANSGGESMSVASSGNLVDQVGERRRVGSGVVLNQGY